MTKMFGAFEVEKLRGINVGKIRLNERAYPLANINTYESSTHTHLWHLKEQENEHTCGRCIQR